VSFDEAACTGKKSNGREAALFTQGYNVYMWALSGPFAGCCVNRVIYIFDQQTTGAASETIPLLANTVAESNESRS
jgi:hypothetical protein